MRLRTSQALTSLSLSKIWPPKKWHGIRRSWRLSWTRMLVPLEQNPRLFSGRSRDISCCGCPKVCVKGQKVVPVYWFEMCTTLYLYSSGCILDGNALKAIRLWEMVRYGFQVYVCYANRSIWSIRCHTSAEASILIRSVSVVPSQLINFNSNPSCPCSYHLLTKWGSELLQVRSLSFSFPKTTSTLNILCTARSKPNIGTIQAR